MRWSSLIYGRQKDSFVLLSFGLVWFGFEKNPAEEVAFLFL